MSALGEREALAQRLRQALDALGRGDESDYRAHLDALSGWRDQALLHSLGRLAREVADALGPPNAVSGLGELPDACSRLEHVVTISEQAAHQTLDLVDRSRTLAATLQRGPLSPTQADALAELRRNLSEVALAQTHQDLGGQIIRRVVGVVRGLHEALSNAGFAGGATAGPALAGPVVAALDRHGVSQDDADALISGLGL